MTEFSPNRLPPNAGKKDPRETFLPEEASVSQVSPSRRACRSGLLPFRLLAALAAITALLAAAHPAHAASASDAVSGKSATTAAITPGREAAVFSQVDAMLASLAEITGLRPRKPISRSLISRDEIHALLESRLAEEITPEELRREELFLKMFGFVEEDFDLKGEIVDVLTEQATAIYDFKTRRLYVADWTPDDMLEFAVVHELAHALADQHFNLRRFVKQSKSSEADIARAAVMEGQASWLMTEHVLRQSGRSMIGNRFIAAAAASASRIEASKFPVFAASPLFLRESMLFPYTKGLLFQQAVIDKQGQSGFAEIFRNPPLSSQHILDPESYFEGRKPAHPPLPKVKLPRRFKKIHEGEIGQLDHYILLKQYLGETIAEDLAPQWRGGHYKILENRKTKQAVLFYAVQWERPEDAARYFDLYKQVCQKKWKHAEFDIETGNRAAGRSETGGFRLSLRGATVTSVEGIPNDTLKDLKQRPGT